MFAYAKPDQKQTLKKDVQKKESENKINGEIVQLAKMSPAQIKHLFKGDVRTNKGKVTDITGYHSTKGDLASPTHEAFGGKTDEGKGTYKQHVRYKVDKTITKESTFFPDTANQTQVIEGIESATFTGGSNKATINKAGPLKDITISKSGDTIFPVDNN